MFIMRPWPFNVILDGTVREVLVGNRVVRLEEDGKKWKMGILNADISHVNGRGEEGIVERC